MSTGRCILRFGIPSLDALLGGSQPDNSGIELTSERETTSLCIIGPEGTGKSILALHLASRYLADALGEHETTDVRVLYISTDLSYSRAEKVWHSFDLGHPWGRKRPFSSTGSTPDLRELHFWQRLPTVGPQSRQDTGALSLPSYVFGEQMPEVGFVDLAGATAGDDWAYVKRIISALPAPSGMRHLVVIDALEGFETLVGHLDSFGMKLSRRSRIAQVMRLAAGKCHVAFVVEDAGTGGRGPEQFVTDAVLRLRSDEVHRYNRRTVEVEKVRAQTHARGQHPITIRRGAGSTTGGGNKAYSENADDPQIERCSRNELYPDQAYVHVFHSLHHQSRTIMERSEPQPRTDGNECAAFGIRYLDDMLAERGPSRGLPLGSVTALIGHPDTQKTLLGHSFLSETFSKVADAFAQGDDPALALAETGAAILITTQDVDVNQLASRFARWQSASNTQVQFEKAIIERLICRRLENHDLHAAVLFHIVEAAITKAQMQLVNRGRPERIRLVIEDLSTWSKIYPETVNEPLFLPFLLFHLRRSGVTTLIINTQPGRPDTPTANPFDDEFRAMVDHQICTWRVPFYGESRIAIAAIPPLSPSRLSVVRQLVWSPPQPQPRRPYVDPDFELYTGLEEGNPQPVPLVITLFDEAPQFRTYIEQENVFFGTRFTPLASSTGERSVIRAMTARQHENLRSLGTEQDTRLDYTLIFQVDEFWYNYSGTTHRSGQGALRSQREYLEAATSTNGEGDVTVDPRALFRPSRRQYRREKESGTRAAQGRRDRIFRRIDLYEKLNCGLTEGERRYQAHSATVHSPDAGAVVNDADRVPFMWDFGFLLCRAPAWEAAQHTEIPRWNLPARNRMNEHRDSPGTVADVWNALPKAYGRGNELHPDPKRGRNPSKDKLRPSWRDFMGACREVAALTSASSGEPTPAFDLALTTTESLACLVLEIWASEVFDTLRDKKKPNRLQRYCSYLNTRNTGGTDRGLQYGLTHFAPELYRTFLLLADAVDLSTCVDPRSVFDCVARDGNPRAVAVRHWYKSACAAQVSEPGEREAALLPVGLPGHFSVRGDWFLATANTSRSSRLADRALDVLSSRRGNFTRMQLGLGLPTRHLTEHTDRIRTGLVAPLRSMPGLRSVCYRDLKELGADAPREFYWLWRSSITNYDMMSRIWLKWIARVAVAWTEFRQSQGTHWRGGLEIYDRMCAHGIRTLTGQEKNQEHWDKLDRTSFDQFRRSASQFEALCELLNDLIDESMPYEPGERGRVVAATV